MPRDPDARYESLSQVLPFVLHEQLKSTVHTSFFGVVIEYDAATKRARIQPAPNLIVQTNGADRSMPRSPILDVPVHQQGTGGYLVHQQIDKGDAVFCIVSERTLDAWKQRWGERYDPMPEILFDQQDAVAIPWGDPEIAPAQEMGHIVQNEAGTAYVWVMGDMVRMVSGDGQTIHEVTPTRSRTAQGAASIEIKGGVITFTATRVQHGSVNVGATHIHPGVRTGAGVTGGPQ